MKLYWWMMNLFLLSQHVLYDIFGEQPCVVFFSSFTVQYDLQKYISMQFPGGPLPLPHCIVIINGSEPS